LDEERLRLAACLGEVGACAALGWEVQPAAESLESLLRRLGWWEGSAWARAALAAARVALPTWQPTKSVQRERLAARRLLEAVEACLDGGPRAAERLARTPAPRRAAFLRSAGRAARQDGLERVRCARRAIRSAARLAGEAVVREAVSATLLGWALGEGEPVAPRG
jgi:hypothetical protein